MTVVVEGRLTAARKYRSASTASMSARTQNRSIRGYADARYATEMAGNEVASINASNANRARTAMSSDIVTASHIDRRRRANAAVCISSAASAAQAMKGMVAL